MIQYLKNQAKLRNIAKALYFEIEANADFIKGYAVVARRRLSEDDHPSTALYLVRTTDVRLQ